MSVQFRGASSALTMMRFLLAIANAETRAQIKVILNTAFPGFQYIELLQIESRKFDPPAYDVALVDDHPHFPLAIKQITDLSEKHPGQPVIMILEECDVRLALRLMKAGAADVILRQDTNEKLVASVHESLLRKQSQERERGKEHLDSMATLVGGIAHDINNALAPIKLALDMLPKVKDPKQIQFVTTTLRTSVERGASMIRQLQIFAHDEEGDRHSLSIRDVVHEVESNARRHLSANIDLTVSLAPGLGRVLGDFTQLIRVIGSLVTNAVEALPNGGRVTIEAKGVSLHDGDASRGLKRGDYIHLQIVDTGLGIPESIGARVLDPFFTTKETGRGLGLATAYGIIRSHRGFLEVGGNSQGGAKASIYLPCQDVEPETSESEPVPSHSRGDGQAILVIDRDESVRQMISATLEGHGYKAIPLAGLLETEPLYTIRSRPIRLAIVDLDAQGRNHLDKVIGLAAHEPALQIVGMSNRENYAKENAFTSKTVVLQKPFKAQQLLHAVEESLKGHAADKEFCCAP
jgi:two-component system, cell cycle sensor histidine kinase and response regulator CckA